MTLETAKMWGPNKTAPRAANAGTTATKESSSLSQSQDIPEGFCQCGCGQTTSVPKWSNREKGYVAGRPLRYAAGHAKRRKVKYAEEDRGYKTPCWIWLGATMGDPLRYGRMYDSVAKRRVAAHRVYYEAANGPIPEGLVIDHLCRETLCVNPDHLEAVTSGENQRRGNNTKLTAEDVALIKSLLGDVSGNEIARRFGISPAAVHGIKTGRFWADIAPMKNSQDGGE